MLVPPSWSSRGKQLGGRVSFGGASYSHYTVAQLMSGDGLLLSGGQQVVSIQVAAEFLSSGEDQTGQWSKKAYRIEVNPQQTLLLHCQPQHQVIKQLRGDSEAASKGYRALYPNLTDAAVNARLGEACYMINPSSLYFCVAICVHKRHAIGVGVLHPILQLLMICPAWCQCLLYPRFVAGVADPCPVTMQLQPEPRERERESYARRGVRCPPA